MGTAESPLAAKGDSVRCDNMLRRLGIEPGEGRIVGWGAIALFLLGASEVAFQNVAETLFNKRVGVDYLPWTYLASSVVLVLTTGAFVRIAARSDRLVLLPRVFLGLALGLLPLWLLARADFEPVFPVLLVAEKQVTSITLLVFWIAMGDLLHSRQAKRLFAPMMAGVTIGTICGSFASEPLGAWLGIESLLLVSSIALVGGGLATLPLRGLRPRLERVTQAAARRPRDGRGEATVGIGALWRESALFRLMLISALCSGVLGPMLYFQFQYVADLGAADEAGLLAFYARFRGWIYGGVLIAQIGVTANVYRRIGIPLAAAMSPLLYLVGFLGLSLRLSLPVGVGAMAGTKLQDDAVYDPARRVLYSLFPEQIRAHASGLLEEPVKRIGGVAGNLTVLAALAVGSALWVGYLAIPIALIWLFAAIVLWRAYPRLLLSASMGRHETLDERALFDRGTVRALVPEIAGDDPERARVALALVADAEPEVAIPALAEAAELAPQGIRSEVVRSLDRVLELNPGGHRDPEASRRLTALLDAPQGLEAAERADLVQAYARLGQGEGAEPVLLRALGDSSLAVRLVARAALARRGAPVSGPPLHELLEQAARSDDPADRRAAREELRAFLLEDPGEPAWPERLAALAAAFEREDDRVAVLEALVDVARRHGDAVAPVMGRVLVARNDPEPRVRAALLRLAGFTGRIEETSWMVEHLGADDPRWASAAREAVLALGHASSAALLRELSFGKRSKRDGILEVMRELELRPVELRALYEAELDAVESDVARLAAIGDRPGFDLLLQRLEERIGEQLHTALLFLAAIRAEEGIAELAERLAKHGSRERQRAIVLTALESLLPGADRERLMPLLESPQRTALVALGTRNGDLPSCDEAIHELAADGDDLTRRVASGVALAAGFEVAEHEGVDAVEKVKHLMGIPLFEGLTTRQLVELAAEVKEQAFPADSVVVHQGDGDDRLYLVVEGVVHIKRGDRLLVEKGPGDFFGEIALFAGVARTATVVAKTRARLLGLERGDLIRLISDTPDIAISLLEFQSLRVRDLTDQLD